MILEHLERPDPFGGQFGVVFNSHQNPSANFEQLFLPLEVLGVDEAHGLGALNKLLVNLGCQWRQTMIRWACYASTSLLICQRRD